MIIWAILSTGYMYCFRSTYFLVHVLYLDCPNMPRKKRPNVPQGIICVVYLITQLHDVKHQ